MRPSCRGEQTGAENSHRMHERVNSLTRLSSSHRDDALAELATSYADMDAIQATLADSAVYVRYLRKRVLELELDQARSAARSSLLGRGQHDTDQQKQGADSGEIRAWLPLIIPEQPCCRRGRRV